MEEKLYYMLYKPQGYISARSDANQATVMELLPKELAEKLFLVGRLDKDTEGLLLLTNDGVFNHELMHPNQHATKTYFFYAMGEMNEEKKAMLEEGLLLKGEEKITDRAKLMVTEMGVYRDYMERFNPKNRYRDNEYNMNRPVFGGFLIITEGRKHQVKRMLLALDCRVIYLKRTAIGSLKLDESLGLGGYRKLTAKELEDVYKFEEI